MRPVSDKRVRAAGAPARLEACLRRALRRRLGTEWLLRDVRCQRLPGQPQYAWEKWIVSAPGGRQAACLFKDFSRPSGSRIRLKSTHHAEREVRVYRDLLRRASLGTPRCYGWGLDRGRGEYWLLLEWVEGHALNARDPAQMPEVVDWLARFQARFLTAGRVDELAFLPRHDPAYYLGRLELAHPVVACQSAGLARRLGRGRQRLRSAIRELATSPQTLVHGEFRPRHVLLADRTSPVRICPLDWECAAVGSTLFDLAYLTSRLAPADRQCVVTAYRMAARRSGVPLPTPARAARLLQLIDLLDTVGRLGKSVAKRYPRGKIDQLVDRARHLMDELGI